MTEIYSGGVFRCDDRGSGIVDIVKAERWVLEIRETLNNTHEFNWKLTLEAKVSIKI